MTDSDRSGTCRAARLCGARETRSAHRHPDSPAACRRVPPPAREYDPTVRATPPRGAATESCRASRNRAITPLAVTMKSSISSLARFGVCARISCSVSPAKTACASMVSKSSAPCWSRSRRSACAAGPASAAARPCRAPPPPRTAVVRCRRATRRRRCTPASPGCAPARRTRPMRIQRPSAAATNSTTMDEPILVLGQRRQIGRQPLGQHRKDRRRRVHRRRVHGGVAIGRRILRHRRVDISDRDQHLDGAVCQPLGRPTVDPDRASRRCRSNTTRARADRASPPRFVAAARRAPTPAPWRRRELGLEAAFAHHADGNGSRRARSDGIAHRDLARRTAAKSSTSASMCAWCVRKLRTQTRPR